MNSITNFTELFLYYILKVFNVLNSKCIFTLFGYQIGYGYFLIAVLLTSILISIFWKGGRV